MGHDQIFKEFLRDFLKDFLELFFPEVEARLDFGGLRFLDTESFTSFPEGSSRAADIVAEVRTREGAREILLVHVEGQARRRRTFAKRMFEYFTLLWAKHRVPIFPVAVYLRGGRSTLGEERFVIRLFGREQLVSGFRPWSWRASTPGGMLRRTARWQPRSRRSWAGGEIERP